MSDTRLSSNEKVPGDWISLGKGFGWITERLMTNDSRFVLDNWDCKYIDARIDMRTGNVLLRPGNNRAAVEPRTAPLTKPCAECGAELHIEHEHAICADCIQQHVDEAICNGAASKRASVPPKVGLNGAGEILGCTCSMCEFHRSAEDIERNRRALRVNCGACDTQDFCQNIRGLCKHAPIPTKRTDSP